MGKRGLLILAISLAAVLGVSAAAYNLLGAGPSARLATPPATSAAPAVVDAPGELDADQGDEPGATDQENAQPEPASTMAPDFTVFDLEGEPVRLSDFRGKPVVLNFWASWCPPCKAEMPEFDQVWAELGEEVHFLMVDLTDGSRETMEDGVAHIEEMGYGFPVYFDLEVEAAMTYYVSSIPTTYFVNARGELVTYAVGAIDRETLLRGIELIGDGSED